ncbi:MAG: hemolysin family protein [bacterium]
MDLVLIVCFLLLSAFYAGSETAYTSFDRILLEVWMRRKRLTARLVRFFASHPARFLGTTLVGNNLVNVAYSTVFALFAAKQGLAPFWIVVTAPFLILIVGEILPKAVFFGLANSAVRFAALPLALSFVLFFPIFTLVRLVSRALIPKREAQQTRKPGHRFYEAEELQLLLLEAHKFGMVSSEEGTFLSRFFVLRDRKVREVMTPRTQVVAISKGDDVSKARRLFIESGHTKLPVFESNLDHIVGYISARDFLGPVEALDEVIRPIEAVPETKPVRELLEEFRADRRHIAVVVDEHGGTDGIVTLEDILEELLGPVEDEFDKAGPICRRIGANRFLVSGRAELDLVKTIAGIEFPPGDYSTLSGFLLTLLGRIPQVGEEITHGERRYRILMADARRVIAILICPVSQEKSDK